MFKSKPLQNSLKILSDSQSSVKGVFRILSNIYDGLFFAKIVKG